MVKASEVLPSVYEFLQQCELTKTARALSKEAELREDSSASVPLFEAVSEWLENHAPVADAEEKKPKKKKQKQEEPEVEEKKKKKKKRERQEEPEVVPEKKKKKKKKKEEEDDSEERRRQEASKAAEEWLRTNAQAPPTEKKKREPGKPFSRVDDSAWLGQIADAKLTDNSYEGTYGDGGYGAKASQKLVQVRGKDFRHEKTKKKRGNYRGGTIDLGTNSIKF